jgi:hypothetical protein
MSKENSSLNDYYFQDQIRKYMVQFMAIFSGMQVKTGKNDNNSESDLIKVPIVHGSKDRVVAHILAGNTPNMPVKLPMIATHINGVEMALDRMKGQSTTHTHTTLNRGDIFPDDIKTVTKLMPIPYRFAVEVNVLTSSIAQKYEILEQIFLLFRPDLQINTSDDADDWTALTYVRLNDIMLEENYPAGTEKRILSTNMNFQFLAWMSAPYKIREDIILKIKARIQNIEESRTFEEIIENAASRSVDGSDEYENIFDVSDLNPPTE